MTRARPTFAIGIVVSSLVAGCSDPEPLPPLAQLVVYVSTDAPLPPPAGKLLIDGEPHPLFDRVRIELYPVGAQAPCDGCTRDVAVDREQMDAGAVSLGVVIPPDVTGYRARVVLHREEVVREGNPRPDSSIERIVALPPARRDAVREVTVMMATDDVARPAGTLDAPVDAVDGPPSRGVVGTWPGAARRPCSGEAAPHEVCIPGGAYWMGNPLVTGFGDGTDADVQRLVVVSPFFFDRAEVTVAAYRAAGVALIDPDTGRSLMPTETLGDPSGDICTFSVLPSDRDSLPVDCVIWEWAAKYCEAIGAVLPTEAQFEYVAGALESRLHVWGRDEPACSDAVFGRAGDFGSGMGTIECLSMEQPAVPPPPGGSGALDRMDELGLVDLAGSVVEWAADLWNRQEEPCWPTGVLFDPYCAGGSPTLPGRHTLRGGGFLDGYPARLRAASRRPGPTLQSAPMESLSFFGTGFRCARPGQ